ncbi:MAG: hypothetical protein KDK36_00815 [Leptospiraceae bacterium]|nr:hypothetical protein [Leptospiraceae bacterium]
MSEYLFEPNDNITEEEKSNKKFKESFNGMTSEVNRVSNEEVRVIGSHFLDLF